MEGKLVEREIKKEIDDLVNGDLSEKPGEVVADDYPSTIVLTDEILDKQPATEDPYEINVGHDMVSEDESNARE
jgi:hypothetical protein